MAHLFKACRDACEGGDGSDTSALIPVGISGATLAFGDGSDRRTLLIGNGIPAITIGTQVITANPVQLMAV